MDQNHAITIDPVLMMMQEMKDLPKILCKFDGEESCCIFKVPQSLLEINKEAYEPQIVSIGPYHHGKDLQMIKELKWRYLYDLLKEMPQETPVKSLKFLFDTIKSVENEIRKSYSESIEHILSNDLAKMMVLDGVFLIELFRKFGKINQNDPISKMTWVLPFFMRDFLKIENQIPFFVLKRLFYESPSKIDNATLQSLILKFFNYASDRPKTVLDNVYGNLEGKHLLDFVRYSFMDKLTASIRNRTPDDETVVLKGNETSIECIQPLTKLAASGVKLKNNYGAGSFLDIKFQNEVLSIPEIKLNDFYTCFILNGMIFEQCYTNCSKDITAYIVFMGCLINTSMDVCPLLDHNIIRNYRGTDKELVKFFNDVGRYATLNSKDNYLKNMFKEINEYCDGNNGQWYLHWYGFLNTYYDRPWTFISGLAAFVLLCLAVLQTFYTINL